jgi:nucleotide-binding universal stress UspA family protein
MHRSVLVPLDGSVFGEHALPFALSIARRAGVPLELAHIYVPPPVVYAETWPLVESTLEPRLREQGKAYLEGVVRRLTDIAPVEVTSAMLEGPVAEALQERVQVSGAGLIAMTTHGRGTLSRFWLGSVADRLVRRAPVPVLLVHPQAEPPDLGSEPLLKRILIPLDGSPLAEQALEPALDLGRLMNADFILLRIVEPMYVVHYGSMAYAFEDVDLTVVEELQRAAKVYLDATAKRLREQGFQVETRVITCASPASAIQEEAEGADVKLVVLATHGRSGLSRALLGSVADKVVRGAHLPVMVCRPRQR